MKLLIIDDHAILREGLVALLRQFEQEADVLQASDAEEGLRVAEANPDIDAVFLDLNMPKQGGMEVIPIFAKRCPQLPVIVLASSEDPGDARLALKAGPSGMCRNPPAREISWPRCGWCFPERFTFLR